jgi:hypothetical protein
MFPTGPGFLMFDSSIGHLAVDLHLLYRQAVDAVK